MNPPARYHVYATSLLADIEGKAAGSLPRRELLAAWLRDFIERSARCDFSLGAAGMADLTAAHGHLVVNRAATTTRPALG